MPPTKMRNKMYLNQVRFNRNWRVMARIRVDKKMSQAIINKWVNCNRRIVVNVCILEDKIKIISRILIQLNIEDVRC